MLITEGALADANEAGRLREQFVAVLGHDLRTPLNAVSMGTDLLERRITDPRSLNIVRAIQQSTLRMGNLIEDVLDFARGKLGGGIPVDRSLVDDLQDHLAAVVLELRLAHPGAVIIDSMDVPTAVFCDPRRLAQSLSNLLGNAITHGAKNEPIQVRGFIYRGAVDSVGTQYGPGDSAGDASLSISSIQAIRGRAARGGAGPWPVYRQRDFHLARRDAAGYLYVR